ncbi:MAG: hypothetical protein ACHQAY_12825 [Hyphomicrobiales bacterium]
MNQKAALDVENAHQAITAQIEDYKNQLIALARQNGTNTPDFVKGQNELNGLYDSLATNPLFKMSPEKIAIEKRQSTALFMGEAVVGHIDSTYTRQGKAAAQQEAQAILNDPNLPEVERQRLSSLALRHLQYLSDGDKATNAGLEASTNKMITMLSGPDRDKVPAEQITQQLNELSAAGSTTAFRRLKAYSEIRPLTAVSNGLTPDQNAEQRLFGPTGDFDMNAAKVAVAGNESGGRYGITGPVQPSGDYALGKYQVMKSNLAAWTQEALGKTMTPAEFLASPDAQEKVFEKRFGDAARKYGPAGAAAIWFTGSPTISGKQDSLGTKDTNYVANFMSQYMAAKGGGPPGAPRAPTQAEIHANPFLMEAYLTALSSDAGQQKRDGKDLGDALWNEVQKGNTPTPENLGALYQIAAQQPELAPRVQQIEVQMQANEEVHRGYMAGSALGGLPPMPVQQQIQQAQELARGGNLMAQQRAEALQLADKNERAFLSSDPTGYAVAAKWITRRPIPLNLADTATLQQAMTERGQAAIALASHTGNADQSALLPEDLPQAKGIIANGTADQKLALMSTLAPLPTAIRDATYKELGAGDKGGQIFAAAGYVNQRDPQAARDILTGEALLKQDARLAPKQADKDAAVLKSMPATDFQPAFQGVVTNAAEALYAKMSADIGDTSQGFNQRRWDAAINKVTGGIVTYRGSNVVVPRYGMSGDDFTAIMKGLGDADFAGAHTADGAPFSAANIKPTMFGSTGWRLQSLDDGRYLVFGGDNASRRYLQSLPDDRGERGGPFILDLRNKVPPSQAPAPSFAGGSPYLLPQ